MKTKQRSKDEAPQDKPKLKDIKALDREIYALKNEKIPGAKRELTALKEVRDNTLPKLRKTLNDSTPETMTELESVHEEIEEKTNRYETLGNIYNTIKVGAAHAFRITGQSLIACAEVGKRALARLKKPQDPGRNRPEHRHRRGGVAGANTNRSGQTAHSETSTYDSDDYLDHHLD